MPRASYPLCVTGGMAVISVPGQILAGDADRLRAGFLLDLNLPGRGGLDVLGEIKADPDLKSIPVVVLTTSQGPEDILHSYQLHTNAYLIKPQSFDRFIDAIRKVDEFFLALIQRPN